MKSKISLACLFLASAACAQTSGFYTGVGAIYSQFDARIKVDGINGADRASAQLNKQTTQITGRLLAGHHFQFSNNSFLSTELFFTPRDSIKKIDGLYLVDPVTTNPTQTDAQLKISRDYTAGLNIKYGRYFDTKTAAFVGLGFLRSQFTATFSDTTPQSNKEKKTKFGISPTVGIMHHIKPKLPITLSYAYDIYPAFKTKNLDSTVGNSFQATFKNRYHTLMVSFSCMF